MTADRMALIELVEKQADGERLDRRAVHRDVLDWQQGANLRMC